MGKFALANLFVVMLLVLFGCAKSQESAETTMAEEPTAPALETVTLAVTGMT